MSKNNMKKMKTLLLKDIRGLRLAKGPHVLGYRDTIMQ